jgi:hypothetical protein
MPLTAFEHSCVLLRHKVYSLCNATPHLARLASLKVQAVGLPMLRIMRHTLKPTTVALQRFGHLASRHIVDLSESQVLTLLHERTQSLHLDIAPGYVILRHTGHILGCGLYTPGCLHSQLPHHASSSLGGNDGQLVP